MDFLTGKPLSIGSNMKHTKLTKVKKLRKPI